MRVLLLAAAALLLAKPGARSTALSTAQPGTEPSRSPAPGALEQAADTRLLCIATAAHAAHSANKHEVFLQHAWHRFEEKCAATCQLSIRTCLRRLLTLCVSARLQRRLERLGGDVAAA